MICINCVTPSPIKKFFKMHGAMMSGCKYCGGYGLAITKKQLFDYIFERVSENVATKDDLSCYELSMLYDCGSDFISIADIGIVLSEWFDLGDEPYFYDLCNNVPPRFNFDETGREIHFYSDNGTLEKNIYEYRWEQFVEDFHYKHRYFNAGASQFLDSIFSILVNNENQLKPEIVRTIAQGQLLYRARHAKNLEQAEEISSNLAEQFGPTPKHLASSQRMTPYGISALYCALERETCLSEIRSITGDHVVSVALTPIDELRLLDLTVLDRVESPSLTLLDVGFRDSLHRKVFLSSLVKKMSRPKARNDELSYLSTQVVFEHLRLRFGRYVDGLVFPSVQTGELGTNVVLFPEASRLSCELLSSESTALTTLMAKPVESPFDEPPSKLAVLANSVRFHKVTAIETKAKEYENVHMLFMSDCDRRRLGFDPE